MSDTKRARLALSSINLSTTIYNLRQSLETGELQDGLGSDIVFRADNFLEKNPKSKTVLTDNFHADLEELYEDAGKAILERGERLRVEGERLDRELELLRALLR